MMLERETTEQTNKQAEAKTKIGERDPLRGTTRAKPIDVHNRFNELIIDDDTGLLLLIPIIPHISIFSFLNNF